MKGVKRPSRRPAVEPHAFTRPEAARYLGISLSSVDKLVANGVLPLIKYPDIQKYLITRESLDRLMLQSETTVPTVPELCPQPTSKYGFLQVSMGKRKA
jgi:excisionase family DNA binding protein